MDGRCSSGDSVDELWVTYTPFLRSRKETYDPRALLLAWHIQSFCIPSETFFFSHCFSLELFVSCLKRAFCVVFLCILVCLETLLHHLPLGKLSPLHPWTSIWHFISSCLSRILFHGPLLTLLLLESQPPVLLSSLSPILWFLWGWLS